jgi:sugar porter (SP) family MFS transporter
LSSPEPRRSSSDLDLPLYEEAVADISQLEDPFESAPQIRSPSPDTRRRSSRLESFEIENLGESDEENARFLATRLPHTKHLDQLIVIPQPIKQPPSTGDRIIGFIMSGGRDKSGGLTGKPLLYFTSVFVSLGVFLFGYDQGVMSGIITGVYFKDYFNQPTRAELGTMVAILEVGALISSLIVGRVGDIIGRRKTILYGAMIFVVGGVFQTFTNGTPMMILGRVISGLGVGMLSTIVPVYQSEISPPHNRGKLACIEFTGNIVGYCSSVWVDYACSFIESNMAWRIPLFLQCVIGSLLIVGSFVIAETPRWLLDNDYDEEGMVVIANLHGGGDVFNPVARQEFRDIKETVLLHRLEGERSYADMWKKYKKRVLIAMSSQAFAQLNGINVISYYAPLVFEQAGWVGRDAILMTGINGIIYVLSTIPPWYLADRWGRRIILMSGAVVMAIALSLISYFMYLQLSYTPTMVVIFVIIFNAFFGYSWGPIPWLYPPEIMPLSVRAKGASLSTASNWAFNFLVGEMTPILQEYIEWRLYLMHAFFCLCSFVLVYFTYPETMGVHLEDMDSLFGDKSVVSSVRSGVDTQSLLSQDDETLFTVPSTSQPSAAAVARAQGLQAGTFISSSPAFAAVVTPETPPLSLQDDGDLAGPRGGAMSAVSELIARATGRSRVSSTGTESAHYEPLNRRDGESDDNPFDDQQEE